MRGFLLRIIGWGLSGFGFGVDDSGGEAPPPASPVYMVRLRVPADDTCRIQVPAASNVIVKE